MQFQILLIEGLLRDQYPLSRTESVSMEEFLHVLRLLGRLLITQKCSGALRVVLYRERGNPYFESSFPSSQGRAIELLPVTDRFQLMLMLAWWLDDWPAQFVAICDMAKLTITDLMSHFSPPPNWYKEAVEQVARGRFTRMGFASYGTVRPLYLLA